MASEWNKQRLEDCMDAIIDYRGKTPTKTDCGIPLITAKIIKKGRILPVKEYIAEKDYDTWMRRGIPIPGDIVLTTEAPLGEVAQLDGRKIALAQRVITLRGKEGFLDNTFLKYLLMSHEIQHQLDGRGTGTTVKGIKQSELREVLLTFPEFVEQKSIAHILGSLDDRIELNRRMNETLESMAQALFKSWFVDFDPVIDNALASGKEIPAELSERVAVRAALGDKRQPLPSEIRTLFPDEFTDSTELGWIPKGWEVVSYSKYAALNQASWTKKNTPENVQYVDLSNTKDGKINLVVPYAFADAPSRARRILKKHDTIIGTVRPGNRSFAYIHKEGLTGSTGFAVMTPKEKRCRSFVYLGLTQDKVIENFAHLADGAAYPAIRPEVVANFESVFPTADLIKSFDSCVYPWIEQMGKHEEQAGTLAQLRDTLLPKLLSGEVRIHEAEKMVEELAL